MRFKVAEPPLSPKMFSPGFSLDRDGQPVWPENRTSRLPTPAERENAATAADDLSKVSKAENTPPSIQINRSLLLPRRADPVSDSLRRNSEGTASRGEGSPIRQIGSGVVRREQIARSPPRPPHTPHVRHVGALFVDRRYYRSAATLATRTSVVGQWRLQRRAIKAAPKASSVQRTGFVLLGDELQKHYAHRRGGLRGSTSSTSINWELQSVVDYGSTSFAWLTTT